MAISVNLNYVNSLIAPAKSPNPPSILLPKPYVSFRNPSRVHPLKAKNEDSNQKTNQKTKKTKKSSIVCPDCDGNGAILCTHCQGTGVNSVDKFDGRFKAGGLCWLCRGKLDILCGSCHGAGFLGGTFDE